MALVLLEEGQETDSPLLPSNNLASFPPKGRKLALEIQCNFLGLSETRGNDSCLDYMRHSDFISRKSILTGFIV